MPRTGGKNAVFKRGNRHIVTLWLYEDDYRDLTKLAERETIPRGTLIRKFTIEALQRLRAPRGRWG